MNYVFNVNSILIKKYISSNNDILTKVRFSIYQNITIKNKIFVFLIFTTPSV